MVNLGGFNLALKERKEEENPMFNRAKEKLSQKTVAFAAQIRRIVRKGLVASVIVLAIAGGSVAYGIKTLVPHTHAIYSAAKLIDGEARGESRRGQKAVFATIVYRIKHKSFPNTMHGVAYQPYSTTDKVLQYNAMGDHLHENLSTDLGQKILVRTAWWYAQWQLGIFSAPREAEGAHSYCVTAACQKQKGYFGTLKLTGTIGNHDFYGDCDCKSGVVVAENKSAAPKTSLRPKVRPDSGSSLAPKTSIRPKARPDNLFPKSEQDGKKIDAAVRAALATN